MSMPTAPVSVVIPCFNCAATIARTVASVAAQTVRPAQVILVDDHSDDDTRERLHRLCSRHPAGWITVVELPVNGGPGTARNAGWEEATQPTIAFLDADDTWHPRKVEVQYGWMATRPEAVLVGHQCALVRGQEGEPSLGTMAHGGPRVRPISRWRLLLSNHFPAPSVMVRRSVRQRFIPGKRHSEDFLLWLQIAWNGGPCFLLDAPLAFLHKREFGSGGLSKHLWKMQRGELDTYRRLHRDGHLPAPLLGALVSYSLMKYLRRFVITQAALVLEQRISRR